MKRIAIAALVALSVATFALADRSDVVLSSSANWISLQVSKTGNTQADGGDELAALVCGTASFPDGGESPVDRRCELVDMSPAQQNAITNFATNALARWKLRRGL